MIWHKDYVCLSKSAEILSSKDLFFFKPKHAQPTDVSLPTSKQYKTIANIISFQIWSLIQTVSDKHFPYVKLQ